jgi:hypothetical protein
MQSKDPNSLHIGSLSVRDQLVRTIDVHWVHQHQHRGVLLKKQIEGSFISDGKSIHVSSVYGAKSFPYNDLGACIDYDAQVLLVERVLSELARDPGSGKFKDLQQQKDDQQLQPMESVSSWSQGSGGTNP